MKNVAFKSKNAMKRFERPSTPNNLEIFTVFMLKRSFCYVQRLYQV